MKTPALVYLTVSAFALLACSGDLLRSCTSAVVGETVEATKEVTKGVSEGIADGRKKGASVDGAHLVSTWEELDGVGEITVFAVEPEAEGAKVVLAVANAADAPMRIIRLEVGALDVDGFVLKAERGAPTEITVPAAAKDKLEVRFGVPPEKLGTIRVWGRDLPIPPQGL